MLYGYRCLEDNCEFEWKDEGFNYPKKCPKSPLYHHGNFLYIIFPKQIL